MSLSLLCCPVCYYIMVCSLRYYTSHATYDDYVFSSTAHSSVVNFISMLRIWSLISCMSRNVLAMYFKVFLKAHLLQYVSTFAIKCSVCRHPQGGGSFVCSVMSTPEFQQACTETLLTMTSKPENKDFACRLAWWSTIDVFDGAFVCLGSFIEVTR